MPDGNRTPFYAARPSIEVADRDDSDLAGALLSLSISETSSGLYRCEAVFGNWAGQAGFRYFDRRTLDFGKRLRIKLGDAVLFDGRMGAIEGRFPRGGPPEIGVLAEDRLQDLRMTRRSRTFADVSDADAARVIASDHGLTPDIEANGPTHRVLAQVNQSDLAFLRERARVIDAEVWADDRTLRFKSHASRAVGTVELALGAKLYDCNVLADLSGQRSRFTAGGWNVASKEGLAESAGEDAVRVELGNDVSGASILSSAFAERKDAVVHGAPADQAEARALAEAMYRMVARRFVVARGTAETDAKLRVGAKLKLSGLGPLFSGEYRAAQVWHRFDGSDGLRTEFVAERPGLGRL